MYVFPEELRKAHEAIPVPLMIDQLIEKEGRSAAGFGRLLPPGGNEPGEGHEVVRRRTIRAAASG